MPKARPWFNRICEEAVQRRYLKRKYVQNIVKMAELDYKAHRTKNMYKRVNDLRGGFKKKKRFLRDDDGSLITTSKELAKKWGDYFEKVLNCEEPNEIFHLFRKFESNRTVKNRPWRN